MIVVIVLSFAFIIGVLFLSFSGEDPEVKVFGLTFFISFFLLGPFFSGIFSIHAPIPMDSENTIDVVSILLSLILAGIALGVYKVIDFIAYKIKHRKKRNG